MERFALEQLIGDITRQATREAVAESGNALSRRQQVDGYWGNARGDSDVGFPQRDCDPFFWRWNGESGTVTIGNLIFYKVDGTWATATDTAFELSQGANYVYAVYSHPDGTLSVKASTTEEEAFTSEDDRTAGNQKVMLYKFTRTNKFLRCDLDRIHHSAVGTNFW